MERRRREKPKAGRALAASVALHAAVVALGVAAAAGAEPPVRRDKVYAVDIVSPPPNLAGPRLAEAPAESNPAPPAPPAATPPAPEPVEPEPEPVPEPPKEAPKEAPKAPERRTETPKTAERREPERPATNRTPPATNNRPPANRPASNPTRTDNRGTSSTDVRSTGEGRRTTPATGRNPDAGSPGGEGLTIRTRGQPCPTRGFCENIVRQVVRFLRVPESAAGSRGDVCFTLDRRGGVDELSVERQRGGGAAFRIALMEAAEQAGRARAFGGLPAAFGADAFPVCVEIEPSLTR